MTESAQLQMAPDQLRQLRALLATHVPTADVWAYGSRVTGTAHESSDLDLVLRHPHMPATRLVSGSGNLITALRESCLPILVEVHQWSELPESFRRQIEKRYCVLQRASVNEDE